MKKILLLFLLLNFFMRSYAQWVHINPGTTDYMGNIDFVTEQIGFVEDWDNGKLWATSNGGGQWTQLFNAPHIEFFNFITPDTGYGCSQQALYRSVDGGHFWNPVILDSSVAFWSRPFFFNLSCGITVQAFTVNGGIDLFNTYKTIDSGTTWSLISSFHDSAGFTAYDVFLLILQ